MDIGSKYFSADELRCKGTGEFKLQDGFLRDLDILRRLYREPMVVTSCCRSLSHNSKIKGHPRSLHLIGNPAWGTDTCAVDIKRPLGHNTHKLIRIASDLGWSIGIAEDFIHLDHRSQYTKLAPVIYTY